jgi:transcriptional regulator with XRE-family HTH domain
MAGLPTDDRRRVQGLRREEVARLAGISSDYYRRLEQGSGHQISLQVCKSLAHALQLDRAGTAYLLRLALPDAEAPFEVHEGEEPPPGLVEMITHWDHTAAYMIDRNQDILVVNDLIRALAPGYVEVGNNLALMHFEATPEVRALPSWLNGSRATISRLRYYGNPSDARWQEIVELLLEDVDFRCMWEEHQQFPLSFGVSPNYFAQHGWVDMSWQVLEAHPGLYTVICYGAPGTLGERALKELQDALAAGTIELPENPPTPTSGTRLARYRGTGPRDAAPHPRTSAR